MENRSMFVGLDVHKDTIDVSIADGGRAGEVRHYGVIAVNLAAYPNNNVDMSGNPSPYIAGVEVSAAAANVPTLVKEVEKAFGTECKVDVFSVLKRRFTSPIRAWALGTPTPGGKGFILIFRKEGTTPEFFYEQWSGPHADRVMRGQGAPQSWPVPPSSEGRRYIHNYVVGRSEGSLLFDGIADEQNGPVRAPTPESIGRAKVSAAARRSANSQTGTSVFLNDKIQSVSVHEIILKD